MKVDDRATTDLIIHFYTAMLGQGHQRPVAALRKAQIAMWKTKGWDAPYYSAAFVSPRRLEVA
jgi:CHAT domain-containing protein